MFSSKITLKMPQVNNIYLQERMHWDPIEQSKK